MDSRPIVIIGPMDSESSLLISALENPREEHEGAYSFHIGELYGAPAVVCRCYIGVVNSAAAAALAVSKYRPRCVILQGTAGAHDPSLHQGDIVLGERMVHLGSFYTPHRDRGEGCDPFSWDHHGTEIPSEPEREPRYLYGDSAIIKAAQSVAYQHGRVVLGTIGAADIWNRELDMIAHLHDSLGTSCEEMEGYGVAQVCSMLGVPMADIRVISNSEWYPDEEFDESVGVLCQEFVLKIIRELNMIQP